MGFNGDLYPEAGATSVLSTKGDIVRYNTERERYGIGSAGQVLQVASSLPTWSTINLADSVLTTQGDVLYEGASALARLGQSTDNYTLATKGAGANPAWQASSTSVLTTTGDLLYASGANTLARLASVSSGQVLTSQGVGSAPAWATAGGGGSVEYIDTQTITGSPADFSQVTFSTAVDFTAYSEMYCSFAIGTQNSRDITFRFGDTSAGAVNTGSYYTYVTTDNTDGTLANEVHAGEDQGRVANHPRVDAEQGVSGLIRIYLTIDDSADTHLQWNSFVNGWDSFFIGGGQYTQGQDDLKYFQLYGGGNDILVDSNITYYKVKRS